MILSRFAGLVLPVIGILLLLLQAAAADEGPRVRLSGVAYLGDLPTLVAERQELFQRHGLTVDVTRSYSGKQSLQALRTGQTDFALMALTPLVLDRFADADGLDADDPVILASLVHSSRLNQLLVRSDSGLEQAADLRGRRVGLMKGTNAEYLWWLFAGYNQFDGNAVTLVDYPVDALAEALVEGAVDAVVLWDPWISRLVERFRGGVRALPGGEAYTAKWVLVSTPRIMAQQPGVARNLLAAYGDAIAFIDANPVAAMGLFAREAGLTGLYSDQGVALDVAPLFGLSLDWSLLAALQQEIEWVRWAGKPGASADTDILSWIDSRPLRALSPGSVGIPGREREGVLP